MKKFYVALVEDGIPKFSSSPVAHDLRVDAEAEAQRLADLHPGKTFKLYANLVYDRHTFRTEPKPKVKTYTGRELQTTAPVGVYRLSYSQDSKSRFFVLDNEGNIVLFLSACGSVERMNPSNWNSDTFVKVDEQFELRLVK